MGGLFFLSFFSFSFTVVTIWLETKACLQILVSFIRTFFHYELDTFISSC